MSPTSGKYIICIDNGRYPMVSTNYGINFFKETAIDFYNPYQDENGGGIFQTHPVAFSSDERYIYLARLKDYSSIIYIL
jgi:hypothetical protein